MLDHVIKSHHSNIVQDQFCKIHDRRTLHGSYLTSWTCLAPGESCLFLFFWFRYIYKCLPPYSLKIPAESGGRQSRLSLHSCCSMSQVKRSRENTAFFFLTSPSST
ncbi:hypothetical protein P389DRAFT_159834, partial [Cystobasidium minutum MCA 4210]|uniref:uncharacterized protein n=1 Tax=Cystobasidium minutum MCA 4210 TaxID=1397322 RepID=UPI0034CEF924|eukprot:jgi/Rhomi1/159834/estExt_Genewise1Plus.C_3_t30148